MYNHRIISFVAFTTVFWTMSTISMTIAWLILSYWFARPASPKEEKDMTATNGHAKGTVKTEPSEEDVDPFSTEGLSESQRSFPTIGRQMPLRFPVQSRDTQPQIKREPTNEAEQIEESANIEPLAAEADDEDDEEEAMERGRRTDSGIGTSLDELDRTNSVQRRRRRPYAAGAS